MAIKRKTLADINININVNTSGKVKKRKKKKKPTKSKGLIQAPNFGSVSPIFPAYIYGTAENSMLEQEKFKNKDLSNMLKLTQGELTESKKILLENTPKQSVKRSDPSPSISSTFISNVDLGTLPSKVPTLARQGSTESAISMRSESLRRMRETPRTVEEDIERLARGRKPTLGHNKPPQQELPKPQTVSTEPLIRPPPLQRQDSVSSDITDDSSSVSTSTPIKVQTSDLPEPLIEPVQKVNPLQAEVKSSSSVSSFDKKAKLKTKDMKTELEQLQSLKIGKVKDVARKFGMSGTQKFKKDDKQELINQYMSGKYGRSKP